MTPNRGRGGRPRGRQRGRRRGGRRGRNWGRGGHGGSGAGHILLLPVHMLVKGLGLLAKLFKHKKQKGGGGGSTMGRHQRARHRRVRDEFRIDRPRLRDEFYTEKGRKGAGHRRANHYFTGVYNVANRHLKRTKLL